MSRLECVILKTDKFDVLQKIVDADKVDRAMPIPLMFHAYQRLVEISPDKHTCLLDFEKYLSLFGPDWDAERQQIIDYVTTDKITEATKVVRSVDYDKWV